MLERIVAQIAVALLGWLDKRIQSGSVAVDADLDRAKLTRAGNRISEWLRKQDDLHSRGQSNTGGPVLQDPSVYTGQQPMDTKQ